MPRLSIHTEENMNAMTQKLVLTTAVSWATVWYSMDALAIDPSIWTVPGNYIFSEVSEKFRAPYNYTHSENDEVFTSVMDACKDLQKYKAVEAYVGNEGYGCPVAITTMDAMSRRGRFVGPKTITEKCGNDSCVDTVFPDYDTLQCLSVKAHRRGRCISTRWDHLGAIKRTEKEIPATCSQTRKITDNAFIVEEFAAKSEYIENEMLYIAFDIGELTDYASVGSGPLSVKNGSDGIWDLKDAMECQYVYQSTKDNIICSVDFAYDDLLRSGNSDQPLEIIEWPDMYTYQIINGEGNIIKNDCVQWVNNQQWNSTVRLYSNGRYGYHGVGFFDSKDEAVWEACQYAISAVEQPAELWEIKFPEDVSWLEPNQFLCVGSNSPTGIGNLSILGSVVLVDEPDL